MSEQSGKKTFQRLFILVSGLLFLGSSGAFVVGLFVNPATKSEQPISSQNSSANEQLKTAEQGYLKVLQREPNNPMALQGLVDTRLKLNDLPGAIAPMETLVKLYPKEENLKALLETIKQQVNQKPTTPENNQTQPTEKK